MTAADPTKGYAQSGGFSEEDPKNIAAYMFAGLAMMLNIRLSYSAAPFALLRFKLPENLFSVFVRTTSSALELWCLPSMLLGNIMEQVYNYTQDITSVHDRGITNYATQIQSKAGALKETATGHSTGELTDAKKYDIQGDGGKGSQLPNKAGQLREKANTLYSKAKELESAAKDGSPLLPLQGDAKQLKDAAGSRSGASGLYEAADALAETGSYLGTQAEKVITQFEEVERLYKALSAHEKYKDVIEGKSTGLNQEQKQKVTAVDEAYKSLEGIYDSMLNLTKLAVKATALKETAAGAGLTQLRDAAGTLETKVKTLRDGPGSEYDNAKTVISQYENVESEYSKLDENNRNSVKDQFEALKTLYNTTFKFTKIKYYSEKLEGAANPVNVNNVITYFQKVVDSYELLGESKDIVKSAFEALKEEYSNAIYSYKWHLLTMPSMITNWLNFLTFVILFIVYISGGDQGSVTGYYWVMAISGFVFGINMVLVYAVDYRYLPYYIAGENSFPIVTSAILYVATSIFGNRRKYNSDYLVVLIDISISIFIALIASVLWTVAFWDYRAPMASGDSPNKEVISPVLLVIVGMGLVYSIYPGIAPGMIVPFYLIDKIEMVLLILTTFPPLIFAFTTKFKPNWSPKTKFVWPGFGGWKEYTDDDKTTTVYGQIWHLFDILAPLQILLAVIFVYSIHYRDSSISRSIVNQPKMSTFLTIIFYMCHEIMLATGFPGLVCNGGVTYVLLPTQWIGALLMVLLAFYSIGYITEYKRHDPSQWPTEGMTRWNALCYWLKMASKITNKNFKQLFTTDLRRDLLLCIQKNELI